jgi:NAD(P)H-dependent FMN reductase
VTPLKVLVILGSVRAGRMSERVATFVMGRLAAVEDVTAELVDLRELNLPIMEERWAGSSRPPGVAELGAKIVGTDAIIIVTRVPGGYGVLKNAIDYSSRNTGGRSALSRSTGPRRRGAWAQLVTVFSDGAIVATERGGGAGDKSFAPDGTAIDPIYIKRTDFMISELVWLTTRVKDGGRGL